MGAEALPESLRTSGVPRVPQTDASADLGSVAYETDTDGVINPGMVLALRGRFAK